MVSPYKYINKIKEEFSKELLSYSLNMEFNTLKSFEDFLLNKCKELENELHNNLYYLFSDSNFKFNIKPLTVTDIEFKGIELIPLNLKSELVLIEKIDYYDFIKPLSFNPSKFKYIIRNDYKGEIENYELKIIDTKLYVYVMKDKL